MATSNSTIETDNPSRLMTRLCKHWQHKFEVEADETRSAIHLPLGVCRMHCDAQLHVALEGDDEQMERFQQVVADHLHRMASRETLAIEWH